MIETRRCDTCDACPQCHPEQPEPASEYTFVRTDELREFLKLLGELLVVRPEELATPVLDIVRGRIAERKASAVAFLENTEGAAGSG